MADLAQFLVIFLLFACANLLFGAVLCMVYQGLFWMLSGVMDYLYPDDPGAD